MSKSKIELLLAQRNELEKKIKIETDKRIAVVGRLAKNADLLNWSNDALQELFKQAASKGEAFYSTDKAKDKNSNKENAQTSQSNNGQTNPNQQSDSLDNSIQGQNTLA